jgi:catecholate siderophore receptor
VAPSIAFGLGTNHEVTLSHLYVNTADIADYGVPFDSTTKRVNKAFSKTDFWGLDNNFDDSETNVTTLNYQWKISSDTQLVTKLRNANYKRSYWAGAPGNATNFATGGSAKTRQSDTDNFVIQSDFSTRFNALGMKHEFIAGVEYLKEEAERWSLANVGNLGVYYKGVVGFTNTAGAIVSTAPANQYTGETYSAYVQDTVEFIPDWKLTAGIRRDEMRSDYVSNSYNRTTNVLTTTSYSGDFGENSYRVGLSWQPQANAHYYVSWSDSFSPTADLYQLAGAQFPAERSKVSEIGAKWLLLDGNLAFRAALYRADKAWERSTDLESTAAVLTRERRTDGIEFELAGRITDNWEVFSGMSVMDPTILKVAPDRTNTATCTVVSPCPVNPNLVGQTARNSPKFTFNLWTTYRLGMGWKVGGGVEHKSKRYGYNPGTDTSTNAFNPNTVPGYTRWDAMVAYEQPKYTVKLNVQNLFDKLYYDALYDNGGFAVPGQARRFILSAEYKF